MTDIRHVLLDADGVVQTVPGGWHATAEPFFGERTEEFLRRAWKEERPFLADGGDYLPVLAGTLVEFGVTEPVATVHAALWHNIATVPATVEVARRLRARGYGVHLGTNQERNRAAHMRTTLGYDDLFDVSCYSCELGVVKPDTGFFAEAARRIGVEPAEVLFVDDGERNVAGAVAAGMSALVWDADEGHDTLVTRLGEFGVAAQP